MTAYYNEIDPYAAQWLRNLINAGHIAPGIVDERSIEDVYPSDLRGFTQCHFFAGIGVWSHALRSAGWSDDRPVWTGSCPCQPFSAAGKGAGFDDQRHLWPHFHHLIKECRPAIVLGEQVASKDADPWIDLVQTDVEAMGYAFGAVPFPSAGVGAPHIRDRLYWVANADGEQHDRGRDFGARGRIEHPECGAACRLDNADHAGLEGFWSGHHTALGHRQGSTGPVAEAGELGGVADSLRDRSQGGESVVEASRGRRPADSGTTSIGGMADAIGGQYISSGTWADQRAMAGSHGALQASPGSTGPTNGFWSDADWLYCRDGRWRPVEPGTFPLAHGASARVGRLRAYGNAICAKAAEAFILCVMESRP